MKTKFSGKKIAAVAMAVSAAFIGSAIDGSYCNAQGTNPITGVNNDVNSEWVESSSPLASGGRVTTTSFPNSPRKLTKVVEPIATSIPDYSANATQRPQILGGTSLGQTGYAGNGFGSVAGYGPVAGANGTVLIPTIQYVPMSSNTQATYQAAYTPIAQAGVCTNCQVGQIPLAPQYQPMAANQTPILPVGPTSGNYQVPNGTLAAPGFYNQVPYAPPAAQSSGGYKSLIPRSLPAGTYIGQGWLGQPKAYVNSQPFRNFLRYLIVP